MSKDIGIQKPAASHLAVLSGIVWSFAAFVFSPAVPVASAMPALVWNPGWPQDKWNRSYQEFALRMARQNFVVLVLDHAPFGETTPFETKRQRGMTIVMGRGDIIGVSQLALRSAETMRCGEYLRARPDVDSKRVAVAVCVRVARIPG